MRFAATSVFRENARSHFRLVRSNPLFDPWGGCSAMGEPGHSRRKFHGSYRSRLGTALIPRPFLPHHRPRPPIPPASPRRPCSPTRLCTFALKSYAASTDSQATYGNRNLTPYSSPYRSPPPPRATRSDLCFAFVGTSRGRIAHQNGFSKSSTIATAQNVDVTPANVRSTTHR